MPDPAIRPEIAALYRQGEVTLRALSVILDAPAEAVLRSLTALGAAAPGTAPAVVVPEYEPAYDLSGQVAGWLDSPPSHATGMAYSRTPPPFLGVDAEADQDGAREAGHDRYQYDRGHSSLYGTVSALSPLTCRTNMTYDVAYAAVPPAGEADTPLVVAVPPGR